MIFILKFSFSSKIWFVYCVLDYKTKINFECFYVVQAYRIGMYGPGYVWMLSGPTLYGRDITQGFFNSELIGCTKEELTKASDGHFVLDYSLISKDDTTTISGKVTKLH